MAIRDIVLKIIIEPVYMVNDFDDFVIRSNPALRQFYAKAKGKKEYPIDGDNILVTDTILQGKEISKEDYEIY